jgi:PAS domain S-box-containing protein
LGLIDFLKRLFETDFMPRGHCYFWQPEMVWLHAISDGLIGLSYYSIPITLFYIARKRNDLQFRRMFLLFAASIFACGTTHFLQIHTLWQTAYGIEGLVKLATGVLSAVTAVLLVQMIPTAAKLPSRTALAAEIAQRRRAEEKFRGLLEAAPDAMVIVNERGEIELVNSQAEAMFGYARTEMLGQSINRIIPERFHDRHAGHLNAYLGDPQPRPMGRGLDLQARRKDGREFPVEISLSPLLSEEGLLVTAAIRDLTERKRVEVEIRRLNADLERRVQERTAELERSNQDLQQFAYVASHDLQEPLRTVASYAQLLKKRYGAKLDEDAAEFIDYAVDGVERMQALISDLLSYSRVSSGDPTRTPTNLNEALDAALENLRVAVDESGARITRDSLPQLAADPVQATLLFQNLVGNAIKYRREEPPHIHVSARWDSDGWIFEVRDNGIGIDPKQAQHIFGVFRRLHGREYPGTGIGLAVCQRIVERHGGRIWVESEPGRGSRFMFFIPESQ